MAITTIQTSILKGMYSDIVIPPGRKKAHSSYRGGPRESTHESCPNGERVNPGFINITSLWNWIATIIIIYRPCHFNSNMKFFRFFHAPHWTFYRMPYFGGSCHGPKSQFDGTSAHLLTGSWILESRQVLIRSFLVSNTNKQVFHMNGAQVLFFFLILWAERCSLLTAVISRDMAAGYNRHFTSGQFIFSYPFGTSLAIGASDPWAAAAHLVTT